LREVLKLFADLGGKLLDTAPSYGRAEIVSGELARELGLVDELFLATKVSSRGREAGISQMETSLQRLHRGLVDLMQVHNLIDVDTQLATLREWKAAGRIRYLGVTTSSLRAYDDFEAVMKREELDFVQVNYSLGTREAADRLLPLAADRGMAVLVNRPYERGRLFSQVGEQPVPEWAAEFGIESWGQFYLKYIISHPAVTCAIPATTKAHHLRDNMGACYGGLPDAAARKRMEEFFDSL
jgi:aryl-alcohol dehydrogenase-like predicted oxidoreductase